jgi:hypothetical protein
MTDAPSRNKRRASIADMQKRITKRRADGFTNGFVSAIRFYRFAMQIFDNRFP